jgi:uracil-DNA glycosylase
MNSWTDLFKQEAQKFYYPALLRFLKEEYAFNTICPRVDDIFKAFKITPYSDVRVVILGQDPYPNLAHATGLAFGVDPDSPTFPASLKNIFKVVREDFGYWPKDRSLVSWARQGVFLLNTILTTRAGEPLSHANQGWEQFTDATIAFLNQREQPMAFLLWGSKARTKKALINVEKHLILEAAHPSPLVAWRGGFFGCKHFATVNNWLREQYGKEIHWR